MHDSTCGEGPFKKAFVDGKLSSVLEKTITKDDEVGRPTHVADLIGFRNVSGEIQKFESNESIYETFARAVGLYNGESLLASRSWPLMLKGEINPTSEQEKIGRNKGKNCFSCRYSIQVKNQNFGLPYRQYIWKGSNNGGSLDVNGDGIIADVEDNTATTDVNEAVKETNVPGVPWCFAFGEEEWMNRISFRSAYVQSKKHVLGTTKSTDVDRRVECI